MSSAEFDNVKVEKGKAIARFNRSRKIAKLLWVVEVVVALVLLSWTSVYLLASFGTSGQLLSAPFSNFFNHHVVFLIGNSIIVMLFVLSRQNGPGLNAGYGDSYKNSVASSDAQQPTTSVPAGDSATSPEPSMPESAGGGGRDNNEKQIDCTENDVHQTQCDVVATAIVEATKQIRRFQRTQSEKLKRQISAKSERELRRQQTERQIVLSSGDRRIVTSLDTVDSLSNDDFRLAIEAFISQHQKFLYAQRFAEEQH